MSGIDIVVRDKIADSILHKIDSIGKKADDAYEKIKRLQKGLNFRSVGTGGMGAIRQMRQLASASDRASSSLSRTKRWLLDTRSAFSKTETKIAGVTRTFRSFASTALLLGATGGSLAIIDSYQTLQNQLRATADSQAQLNQLTQETFDIAQRARVPIDGLAKTYRRIDDALKPFGVSQRETLGITETLSKLLTLSGASATEAASALLQVSQAFNKGKLDGDEFRSVAELMPQVLDAMAKKLGVARGALFDLSQEGKLTGKLLGESMLDIKDQVDSAMEALPRTAGQAFTQLLNAIKFGLGKTSTESGLIAGIVSGLDLLRNNLETVGRVALIAAGGLSALVAVQLAGWLFSLLNPLTSFPALLMASIGYFAFFSSSIRVTAGEAATLSDYAKTLLATIREFGQFQGIDFLGELFTAKGAQQAFDVVKVGLSSIQAFMAYIYAQASGLGHIFENMNIAEILGALGLGLVNTFNNGAREILAFLADQLDKFFQTASAGFKSGFLVPLNAMLEKIGAKVVAIGQTMENWKVPGASGVKQLGRTLSEGIEYDTKNHSGFGFGLLADELRNAKKEASDFSELFRKLKDSYNNGFQFGEKSMTEGMNQFYDMWNKKANESADQRLQKEKASLEALRQFEGDSLLRQSAPGLDPTIQQTEESSNKIKNNFMETVRQTQLLKEGLEGINSSGFKQLMEMQKEKQEKNILDGVGGQGDAYRNDPNSPFTEGFIQKAEAAFQAQQKFNSSLNQTSEAFSSVAQASQSNPINDTVGTGAELQSQAASISAIGQAAASSNASVGQLKTNLNGMGQGVDLTPATQSIQTIAPAAGEASSAIGAGISSGAAQASGAVSSMSSSTVGSLNQVTAAAYEAAAAVASIGSGGGGGSSSGGFGGMSVAGFSQGGYTGNIGRNNIAGVVHGNEYVMPAGPTKQYRPLLEAMHQGKRLSSVPQATTGGSRGGGGMTVNIENYGGSRITAEQIGPNEMRIIAREEARKVNSRDTPKLVAREMANPNSQVSKSLQANTQTKRRR